MVPKPRGEGIGASRIPSFWFRELSAGDEHEGKTGEVCEGRR